MTRPLLGKRILFISPSFFGYEVDIASEMRRQGAEVVFVDERPSNSALMRAVLRVRRDLVRRRTDKYYQALSSELAPDEYDIILVVKGEVVPAWFIERVERLNPDALKIFYTFDAIDNAPNCKAILHVFDRRKSFDRRDVEQREDFEYLPLFYVPEFEARRSKEVPVLGTSFVGTLHSERYDFATAWASEQRDYRFFFVQARWYFFILKYVQRVFRHVAWSEVSFRPLPRSEVASLFRRSHRVLDMQRSGQAGLTMRTFEVLAAGACLITTNAAIRDEPFYDPSRVLVVSHPLSAPELAVAKTALSELKRSDTAPPGFTRYSLESWVNNLLSTSAGQDEGVS